MTDPFADYRAAKDGYRFATPERIAQLSRERFKPWPLYKPPAPRVVYNGGNREPRAANGPRLNRDEAAGC